jgi:calcium/calmodulin-dependent protein kinase I
MSSIQGTAVKEEAEEVIDAKITLHPFTVFSGTKGKTYYALKKEEQTKWLKSIREEIGCYNFSDYYDIKDVLGKGKFGLVRMAIHKGTKKSVAVKIMKKKEMNTLDIELMRREIEILKICQHPNIIRLLDIFENFDYIFIVMEHLKGGDMFAYLEKRKFHIPEERAASLIYSVAVALSYLHSYGIAHRDLKPENILLISDQQDADIKLMDFGLSKIIAPDEKSVEPFGTLSYVAPEVLKTKPYGKAVDLWSLGVISYLLICGVLPFDDDKDSEIARMILNVDPNYSFGRWKTASTEAIDFTQRLLCKDKDKRMTLNEVLKHAWLQKHMTYIKTIRKKSANDELYKPVFPNS